MNLPLLGSYDYKNDLIMKKMVVNQVKKKLQELRLQGRN